MKDPHVEFSLLRSCLSIPKIMFTLRTTNPLHHLDIWESYDNITREAFGRIMGAPLTDIQWSQAVLPVSLGGIGLRSSSDHSPAAYACSFLAALDLKDQILGASVADENLDADSTIVSPELVESLERKVGSAVSVAILRSESQKELSLKIDLQNHKVLKEIIEENGRVRDIARINSLSLPNAGAWLNVVPSPALGLHLRPTEFIVSVKYRLGLDIFQSEGKCTVQHVIIRVIKLGTMLYHAGTKEKESLDMTILEMPFTLRAVRPVWVQRGRLETSFQVQMPGQQIYFCLIGRVVKTLPWM